MHIRFINYTKCYFLTFNCQRGKYFQLEPFRDLCANPSLFQSLKSTFTDICWYIQTWEHIESVLQITSRTGSAFKTGLMNWRNDPKSTMWNSIKMHAKCYPYRAAIRCTKATRGRSAVQKQHSKAVPCSILQCAMR